MIGHRWLSKIHPRTGWQLDLRPVRDTPKAMPYGDGHRVWRTLYLAMNTAGSIVTDLSFNTNRLWRCRNWRDLRKPWGPGGSSIDDLCSRARTVIHWGEKAPELFLSLSDVCRSIVAGVRS